MDCPKCTANPLKAATVKGIEVDQCAECHGIWFDEQELVRLLAFKATDVEPLAKGRADEADNYRPGQCPRDRERLMRVRSALRPAVTLDVCPKCRGVWLDGGELAQIMTK